MEAVTNDKHITERLNIRQVRKSGTGRRRIVGKKKSETRISV